MDMAFYFIKVNLVQRWTPRPNNLQISPNIVGPITVLHQLDALVNYLCTNGNSVYPNLLGHTAPPVEHKKPLSTVFIPEPDLGFLQYLSSIARSPPVH